MPKVHIIYGFTEGKWHGKKMRRALRRRGFKTTKWIERADFVIAHSGGCYSVPPLVDNQVLVLINPPYWPNRSLRERANNMTQQIFGAIRPGNKPVYHLRVLAHNIVYFAYHVRTNIFMMRSAKTYNLEQEVRHHQTIVVRNNHDPWLTPDLEALRKLNPHVQIKHLDGEHNDCWLHPDPYIDYLEQYSKAAS